MSYNKASEEKKWKRWKTQEELILRKYGVPEWKIRELYHYDWEMFNSDRRFKQRFYTNNDLMDYIGKSTMQLPIRSIQDILDQIENEKLYQLLQTVNKQTMDILYLKICGYSTKEIAVFVGLSEEMVRYRIRMIRRKLKDLD